MPSFSFSHHNRKTVLKMSLLYLNHLFISTIKTQILF